MDRLFMDMEQPFFGGNDGVFNNDSPPSPSPSSSNGGDDQSGSDDDDLPDNAAHAIPLNGPLRNASASEIKTYVSEALKRGKNLLVECPPTLNRRIGILQSVLDYYLHKKGLGGGESPRLVEGEIPSRIYLTTENFEEMERVVADIRRDLTSHMKNLRMAVLGSRNELCINNEVRSQDGIAVEKKCNKMIQCYNTNSRREDQEICPFYQNAVENDTLFTFVENPVELPGFVLVRDIEDFVIHGQENDRCPFFDSHVLHSRADLIICPIQILLSPVLRREFEIDLDRAIVIIDDGHEIEKLCYDEGSIIITDVDLRRASSALRSMTGDYQRMDHLQPGGGGGRGLDLARTMEDFGTLVEPLRQLAQWIQDEAREDTRPSKDDIFEKLLDLRVNANNVERLCHALHRLPTQPGIVMPNYEALEKLKKFFTVLLNVRNNRSDFLLKVIQTEFNDELYGVLRIICANANLVFGRHVERPALSVIVGGDCLAPISNLETELGVEFHDILRVSYDPAMNMGERYFLGYCSKGPNKIGFALNYEERSDDSIKLEVVNAIVQLCEIIPNGVVVVFHSIRYFRMILSLLGPARDHQEGTPYPLEQLQRLKHVVIKLNNGTPEAEQGQMEEYRDFSKRREGSRNGALLLVYARDPLYKQSYLKGEEIRGIIHVSISYAEWHHNHIVVARRRYFNEILVERPQEQRDHENLCWYEREAYGVLNQSFARCVRPTQSIQDPEDWGLVIILDNRMRSRRPEFRDLLPKWVLDLNIFRRYGFGRLVENAQRFVAGHTNAG